MFRSRNRVSGKLPARVVGHATAAGKLPGCNGSAGIAPGNASGISYVLGDAAGNLVACQCLGGLDPVVQDAADHGGMVFHQPYPYAGIAGAAGAGGLSAGYRRHSAVRFAAVARARGLPRTLSDSRRSCGPHDGSLAAFGLPQRHGLFNPLALTQDRPAPCIWPIGPAE